MNRIAEPAAQRAKQPAHGAVVTAARKYVYAVVADAEGRSYGANGIDGGAVYSISDGRVAAVVTDVPGGRIRPERRHLAVHQDVLKKLMAETTPLPMSFGVIADDLAAIERILSLNREAFLAQLRRVSGKVEMGLRVTWDVPNIFEYLVDTHPELRSARDRLLGSHREATQENKIEVGRLFDRILHDDRDSYTDRVEAILRRHCFETKTSRCRNEREVMNLACLVGREAQPAFEEDVFETAKLFDHNFAFDYNGPWAPHNFVEIDLKL